MSDVQTPIEGSEAVGTHERDSREPKPMAVPHPSPGERARGARRRGGAALWAWRMGAGL